MTANQSTFASVTSTGATRCYQTETMEPQSQPSANETGQREDANEAHLSEDVHLSELVRSLRALASGSPERQARIEQLARAYANGSYQVNSEEAATRIIDDALAH